VTEEKWYSIQEAADFLGISTITLRRYIKDKKIGAYRIAGRYRFKKESLENFLDACRLEPQQRDVLKGNQISNVATATKNTDPIQNTADLADAVLHKATSQTKSLYIKAFTASRLGRYEEAEAYYRKVLKKQPQESAAYLFLGLLYQEMKDREKALQMWREVVSIDKDSDLAEVARYYITRALRSV